MAENAEIEIERTRHLPYHRQQSDRQKYVDRCTLLFDGDGDILKFLLALCSKTNADFGCLTLSGLEEEETLGGIY